MIDQLNELYDNILADLEYFTETRQWSRASTTLNELQDVYRKIQDLEVEEPF